MVLKIKFVLLGADHFTLGGEGVGDFWSSIIFFPSNLVGRIFFFPFFPMSFLLHLCCMQFSSSDKRFQEFFSQNQPPPPPQELNGRPLIGTESTVLVRSGYSFVAVEVKV